MKVNDFDYNLPEELIAKRPEEKRDNCKLLLVDRENSKIYHKNFYNILDYLQAGDCLVMNNSKVIPARLFGVKKITGAKVEFLLTKNIENNRWETMVKPGKRLKIGDEVEFYIQQVEKNVDNANNDNTISKECGNNVDIESAYINNLNQDKSSISKLTAKVVDFGDNGTRIVDFEYDGNLHDALNIYGNMPLPPYINRKSDEKDKLEYQTVYCDDDKEGSVASPTAGLHFTDELLHKLQDKGVKLVFVTLNVGIGTFRPVKVDNVEEHSMHFEQYSISEEAAKEINESIIAGNRVIAVGTTSTRTMESAAYFDKKEQKWLLKPSTADTDIFIFPGYEFKIIDALITNFHLPKSTLLMLISALYNREDILKIYNEAVEQQYRFFSYGDAMFIY
ncbi:MAG: tRNA preQ1(34) S-adenosylmethionine ribosyltransferase-isomerase QueA [Eubacteriales bacterium]|nr:tRNA preQ1(34) S-adenosylmethionine ribosyltransferase-isomerase QueA [Eubacteriales bacterium]MDY3332869.1 tRNA preQ1(34) S-adenosylmethionine ribosyltransferase-isomerase QueA [Gallibacter sp.]